MSSKELQVALDEILALISHNDPHAAEERCKQINTLLPNEAAVLKLWGTALIMQERYGEAVGIFDQLCRLQPDASGHWVDLGNAYRGTGNHDNALKAFSKAAGLGDKSVAFLFNLGLTHMARGDFEAARVIFSDAREIAPADTEILYRYVLCCYECLKFDLALKILDDWTPPVDSPAETIAGIAQMLLNMGEYARAEETFKSLPDATRNSPRTLIILVQILERTNRVEAAADILKELKEQPGSQILGAELQRVAAKLAQRQSKHGLAVELYRQALADYREPHDRHFVLFPLAESLDRLGMHDDAIRTLHQAHLSQVAFIERSRPGAALRGAPQMEITHFSCDPEDIATWRDDHAPSAAESPVFVVAFPRSGTTLLELTLDAHPLLQSMDEQPFVQNMIEDALGYGKYYPELLGKLTQEQLDAIRSRYWERVGRKLQLNPNQRLVDKNPLNMLRLPIILRTFPNAAILLAIRHPCDVILSCYMQHFRAPDFAMMCADLPSLTLGYRRTFDFWYEQLELLRAAGNVHELHYERFVADFPQQAHQITDFLGLPWDEALLSPARRAELKGYVSTPSYSQVVQPVNQKAVGRWEAYRKYLEPAIPIVQPYLERWNYSA